MIEKAKEIKREINKAKHILLHCHPSPDPDSVGSALAMKLALEQMGKKVTAIRGDREIPKAFAFPGVETIEQKSYGEINAGEYDLFIILDSGSVEMISREGVVFPDSMVTIVIDHHISNKMYGNINCVDASYSSTSEIIFDLFEQIRIKLNHDIALNLFMGIYCDTGGFRYGGNSAKTLKIVSELANLAPDFQKTIDIMENSNRKESLIFEALALSSIKNFFNDRLIIAHVSYDEFRKHNFSAEDIYTGYISNKLASVIGYDLTVTMIGLEPNLIKTSFRTRDEDKYDVSKIAVALGGGGHKGAAGARLSMPMQEAIDKVVKTAKEIYNL